MMRLYKIRMKKLKLIKMKKYKITNIINLLTMMITLKYNNKKLNLKENKLLILIDLKNQKVL